MQGILIPHFFKKRYSERITPILESKGLKPQKDLTSYLQSCPVNSIEYWVVPLSVPLNNTIYEIDFSSDSPKRIYDCYINLEDKQNLTGKINVKVKHVFGEQAYCKITNGYPGEVIPKTEYLLVLKTELISAIADIVPDQDCFQMINIWANEMIPSKYLAFKPNIINIDVPLAFRNLNYDDVSFAIECDKCHGNGEIDCSRCKGSGIYKPRRDCPKCDGTGDYIGKYGDRMGDCRACDGEGYWEQQDCMNCDGSGSVECYPCHSEGMIKLNFRPETNAFFKNIKSDTDEKRETKVAKSEVTIFDWTAAQDANEFPGAQKFLNSLIDICQENTLSKEKINSICQEFASIGNCLKQSIDSQGLINLYSILISGPKASLKRIRHGVIYEFKVLGESKPWMRKQVLPFPIGTPVEFYNEESTASIDFKPLKGKISKYSAPTLLDIDFSSHRPTILIRFDSQVDIKNILGNKMAVKPDIPPPSERSQIRHLKSWIGWENKDHPVLHGMVGGNSPHRLPEVIPFNPQIAKYKTQVEAVAFGIGECPVSLIKGPPGTGKTTVITEIVRQSVRQGKKVLVCSQTHQAVSNVLERLHREGSFCMVRHGDESNLTELEKQYTYGALAGEFKKIHNGSTEAFENIEQSIKHIENSEKLFKEAYEGANKLKKIREKISQKTKQANKNYKDKKASAIDSHTNKISEYQAKAESQTSKFTEEIRKLSKLHSKTTKSLTKEREKKKNIEDKYYQKYNKRIQYKRSTQAKGLDSIVPNFLASEKVLLRKYSTYTKSVNSLENDINSFNEKIENASKSISTIEKDLKEKIKEKNKKHKLKCSELLEKKDKLLSELEKELIYSEKEHIKPQKKAVEFGGEFGGSPSEDSNPEVWNELFSSAQDSLAIYKRKYDLSKDWNLNLAANKELIVQFAQENMQVFFSTCVGFNSWRDMTKQGREAIDLVIIDEAAHATIPESIIPILYSKRVILIGDEKQLPPIITCELQCDPNNYKNSIPCHREDFQQKGCWLEESLFEYLWLGPEKLPRTMLDTQFRMHPDIADFVSQFFYENRLKTGIAKDDRKLSFTPFNKPVCLIPTSTYKNREEDYLNPGYRNFLEAKMIKRVIENAEKQLTETHTFGIITPYGHQVSTIHKELKPIYDNLEMVDLDYEDIASVDKFQGAERDVIIISFVRSPQNALRARELVKKRENNPANNVMGKGIEEQD